MKLHDTEYAYASARIRAAEGSLTARERAERISGAKTHSDLVNALSGGSDISTGTGIREVDKAASDSCKEAASLVLECAPDPSLLKFLFYPADCNNIKAAVKAQLRGVPCDDILSNEGSVPAEKLSDMLADRDFSELPAKMREAVPAAIDAYVKNRDPQTIDFIIDRACFADMSAGASLSGSDTLVKYNLRRTDAANIMTYLRLTALHAPLAILKSALVVGGSISAQVFETAYPEGVSALAEALTFTDYGHVVSGAANGQSPDVTECALEDHSLEAFSNVRYQAFGIEVLAFFIVSRMTEAKNARIMAASIEGNPQIADRLRVGYI